MAQLITFAPPTVTTYGTIHDALGQADRAEVDVLIPDWQRADGTPLKWRIRSLSLVDQDAIHRAERLAIHRRNTVLPDDTDYPVFAAETIRRCMVVPSLDDISAKTLIMQSNPAIMRQLVDLVWGLSDKTMAEIEVLLVTLTTAPPDHESAAAHA